MRNGRDFRAFVAELRRRQVSRAALLYVVAAYAVLQFVDTILVSALGFPEPLLLFLVVMSAAGLPVVVALAWAVQLTPLSVRSEGGRPLSEFLGTGGRVVAVLVVALVSVGMGVSGWQLWGRGDDAPRVAAAEAHAPVLDPARIAVLYFDDHTPGGEYGFLADALTELLIHHVARIEGFDVVSRNGVRPFRGEAADPGQVARALRAGSLVEGSVAPGPGGGLRVTVQLIDGATLSHVHTDTRDALPGDWIALQDSLVSDVAAALGRVTGREVRERRLREGNRDDGAWALFWQASRLQSDHRTIRRANAAAARALLIRADSLLAAAERLDPAWVEPPLLRGWIGLDLAGLERDASGPQSGRLTAAVAHADRALSLGVDSARALELRGVARIESARTRSGALRTRLMATAESDLMRAVQADPKRANAWQRLSVLLLEQGRIEEAGLAARRTVEADEFLLREADALFVAAYSALQVGPESDALRQIREGRVRFPDNPDFIQLELVALGTIPHLPPDVDAAWRLVDSLMAAVTSSRREAFRAWGGLQVAKTAARAGLADSARAIVRSARGAEPVPGLAYDEAQVELMLGEPARAVELLRMALEADVVEGEAVSRDWVFADLRADPDFARLVGPPDS